MKGQQCSPIFFSISCSPEATTWNFLAVSVNVILVLLILDLSVLNIMEDEHLTLFPPCSHSLNICLIYTSDPSIPPT